jgi:hypothetical protein
MIEALHRGREPNEQLLPELYRSAANDVFGDKLGQRFGTYRKNYDEAQRKRTGGGSFVPLYAHLRDLHSFRHSFCTELIRAGVPKAHAEELTGHESREREIEFRERESAFENYNHGATLQILKAASDKRVLPIDIPKLIASAARSPSVVVQALNKRRSLIARTPASN